VITDHQAKYFAYELTRRFPSDSEARLAQSAEGRGPREALRDYVDFYLSPEHRDDPGHGCTMGALGSEIARADESARAAFAEGFDGYLETFRALSGVEREEALARYATMVGALVIARATAGEPISDEVLSAARNALLD